MFGHAFLYTAGFPKKSSSARISYSRGPTGSCWSWSCPPARPRSRLPRSSVSMSCRPATDSSTAPTNPVRKERVGHARTDKLCLKKSQQRFFLSSSKHLKRECKNILRIYIYVFTSSTVVLFPCHVGDSSTPNPVRKERVADGQTLLNHGTEERYQSENKRFFFLKSTSERKTKEVTEKQIYHISQHRKIFFLNQHQSENKRGHGKTNLSQHGKKQSLTIFVLFLSTHQSEKREKKRSHTT